MSAPLFGFGNALAGLQQGWQAGEDRQAEKRARGLAERRDQQQFDLGEIQLSEAQKQAKYGEFKRNLDNAMGRLISTQGADYTALQEVYNSQWPDGNQATIQPVEGGGYQLQFSDGTTTAVKDWQELGRLAASMADPNAYMQAEQQAQQQEIEARQKAALEERKLQNLLKRDEVKYGYDRGLEELRYGQDRGLEGIKSQNALTLADRNNAARIEAARLRQSQSGGGAGGGGAESGTYRGTSMEAQDSNILLNGDPNSAEYGLAWHRQFNTPKFVQTDQGMVPIMIPPPPGLRPPTTPIAGGTATATGLQIPETAETAGGETPTALPGLPAVPALPMLGTTPTAPGLNLPATPSPVAGPVIPGTERSPKEGSGGAKLKAYEVTYKQLERSLAEYERLLKKTGTVPFESIVGTPEATRLMTAFQMVQMGLKDLHLMGAPQAKDIELLERELRPPSDRSLATVWGGAAGLQAQIEQVRQSLKNNRAVVEEVYGGQSTPTAPGAVTGQSGIAEQPKILKYNPATGKIE